MFAKILKLIVEVFFTNNYLFWIPNFEIDGFIGDYFPTWGPFHIWIRAPQEWHRSSRLGVRIDRYFTFKKLSKNFFKVNLSESFVKINIYSVSAIFVTLPSTSAPRLQNLVPARLLSLLDIRQKSQEFFVIKKKVIT